MGSQVRKRHIVLGIILSLLVIPETLHSFPNFFPFGGVQKTNPPGTAIGIWGNLLKVPKLNPSLFVLTGLEADSLDRDLENQSRRILITAGRLKPNLEVFPQQFFNKYSKDLGLRLNEMDVAKKISVQKGNPETGQKTIFFYEQFIRNPSGNLIPVMNARAGLEVDEDQRVVSFFHSFVPDLAYYLKDLNPKITYDEAVKLASNLNQVKKLETPTTIVPPQQASVNTDSLKRNENLAVSAPEEHLPELPANEDVEKTTIQNQEGLRQIRPEASVFKRIADAAQEEIPADSAANSKFMQGNLPLNNESLQNIRTNPQISNTDNIKFDPKILAPGVIEGEKLIGPKVEENQVIFFKGNRNSHNARLAWKVVLSPPSTDPSTETGNSWIYYIDALNGEILSSEDALVYSEQEGDVWENTQGTGIPYPYYGNTGEPISILTIENQKKGIFALGCQYSEDKAPTKPCFNGIAITSRVGKVLGQEASQVTDDNNIFAEKDKPENIHRVDVSVMKGLQLALEYLGNKFEMQYPPISVLVTRKTTGSGQPIAAYDRVKKLIILDGFGNENLKMGPMVAYDVIGHEVFHAIFDKKFPHLDGYSVKTAIKPIVEGSADFFGEVIENPTEAKPLKGLFGEEIHPPYISNIANPKENWDADTYEGQYFVTFNNQGPIAASYIDPKTKQITPCEAETGYCNYESHNSTVWSHFLYMLSEGGSFENEFGTKATIQGIGKLNTVMLLFGTLWRLRIDEDMPRACLEATRHAAKALKEGYIPNLQDYAVESTLKACDIANLGNYGEKRYYSPSKESGKDMGLPYSPTELTWEVFPDNEHTWVVEVFDWPLSDAFKMDPNEKYDIQTAVIGKDSIVQDQENGRSLVSKSFELQPNKVYSWHICPISNDGTGFDSKVQPSPGVTLSDLNNCKNWRPVQTFSTKEARATLKSPVEKVAATPDTLAFTWKGVKGMATYEINIYEISGGNSPGKLNSVFPLSSEKVCDEKLECKYEMKWEDLLHNACWSVFSKKDDQSGVESDTKCWSVLPAKVKLSSPLSNIPFSANPVTLKWEKAEAATSYIVNVCDRNPNGNAPACETFNTRTEADSALSVEIPSIGTKGHGFCWQVLAKNTWLPDEQPSGFTCVPVDPEKPKILSPTTGTILQPNSSNEYLFSFEWQDSSPNLHRLCVWPGDTPPGTIGDADACWSPMKNDPKKLEVPWISKANPKILYLQIATLADDGKTFINRSDPVVLYLKAGPTKPVIKLPTQNQEFKKATGSAFDIPISWTGDSEGGFNLYLFRANESFSVNVGSSPLYPAIKEFSYNQTVSGENSKYKVIVAGISKNNVIDSVSDPVYFSTGLISAQDDPPDPNATPSCNLTNTAPQTNCPGALFFAFGTTTDLCTSPYQFQVQQYPGDQSKIVYDLQICKSSGKDVSTECETHSFSYSDFGAGSPIKMNPAFEWAWRAQVRVQGCPTASPPSSWRYFNCGPTGNCPSNI